MKRFLALSSYPAAEEAAFEYLENGGSAIGAVLASYFTAAGALPGVLMSPLSILVGGIGVGSRAFDGRLRQPGLGIRRPRGFLDPSEIPDAARVAVAGAPAAAAIAHAYDTQSSLAGILRRGIAEAKRAGALRRAEVLAEVASSGARFLTNARIQHSLLGIANPGVGGLLSLADLTTPHALDSAALESAARGKRVLGVPWHADTISEPVWEHHGSVAIDARGGCAAISFRNATRGLELPELELQLPLAATPVERGVPRIRPGLALGAAAPLAIILDAQGVPLEVTARITGRARSVSGSTLKLLRSAGGGVHLPR